MKPDVVVLCSVDDIPEREARGFDPLNQGRDTLFVVKKKGQLYGYTDICPHYGDTTLPWCKHGYLDGSGTVIVCAAHGAQFDIETGECFSGPCYGQSLTAIPLDIGEDGSVRTPLD